MSHILLFVSLSLFAIAFELTLAVAVGRALRYGFGSADGTE